MNIPKRIRVWLWERELRKAYEWKVKSGINFKAAEKLIGLLIEHGKENGLAKRQ